MRYWKVGWKWGNATIYQDLSEICDKWICTWAAPAPFLDATIGQVLPADWTVTPSCVPVADPKQLIVVDGQMEVYGRPAETACVLFHATQDAEIDPTDDTGLFTFTCKVDLITASGTKPSHFTATVTPVELFKFGIKMKQCGMAFATLGDGGALELLNFVMLDTDVTSANMTAVVEVFNKVCHTIWGLMTGETSVPGVPATPLRRLHSIVEMASDSPLGTVAMPAGGAVKKARVRAAEKTVDA